MTIIITPIPPHHHNVTTTITSPPPQIYPFFTTTTYISFFTCPSFLPSVRPSFLPSFLPSSVSRSLSCPPLLFVSPPPHTHTPSLSLFLLSSTPPSPLSSGTPAGTFTRHCKIVFGGATAFTFAGNLSAWDVRVVADMNDMFGNAPSNFPNVSAAFCGFYWTTSSTAVLEFGLNTTDNPGGLIPDIR